MNCDDPMCYDLSLRIDGEKRPLKSKRFKLCLLVFIMVVFFYVCVCVLLCFFSNKISP